MAKRKNKITVILALVLVVVLGVMLLTACNNDPKATTYSVTFMVRKDATGDWEQHAQKKTNAEGIVELPEAPVVNGYAFRAWYKDEACTQVFDVTQKLTADTTLYALMSDDILTINIKGADGTVTTEKNKTVARLAELEKAKKADAATKNLVFDYWYTDAACTIPYVNGSNATTIYSRYAAKVTFSDGYRENIEYSQLVNPGEKMVAFEDSKVKASYMADELYYSVLDANGKPVSKDENGAAAKFDIAKTNINTNTTLGIMWSSKGLIYEKNDQGHLIAVNCKNDKNYDSVLQNDRVIRFPEYATFDGELLPVDAVVWDRSMVDTLQMAETLIFADGIKFISGCNAFPQDSRAPIKSIVLPDSLKVLDSTFKNIGTLEEIVIPEGVEVIIDSLWKAKYGVWFTPEAYGFDIQIPASVKNLSLVPNNFKFAENSPFFYEGNALYKKGASNNYETLISSYDLGKEVIVKEGVKFIQVGALITNKAEYITIPSTFENVAYNENADLYPFYTKADADEGALGDGFRLYKEGKTTPFGLAMITNLESLKQVKFNTVAKPVNMANSAIMGEIIPEGSTVGDLHNFMPNPTFENVDKVVFIGTIADNESVNVKVRAIYKDEIKQTKLLQGVLSNNTLVTQDMIAELLGLKGSDDYTIKSITQFGKDFFTGNEATKGKVVTCNQYLEVVYVNTPGGATMEDIAGTMTVTGFNKEKAYFDTAKGGYVVTIPETFQGKPVKAIKASAFEGNGEIIQVNIPANVEVIGDNAFKLATKLVDVIFTEGSKLASIGVSAFEDTAIVTIAVPLKQITEIKPYAFRTKTLKTFTTMSDEQDKALDFFGILMGDVKTLETGYYIHNNAYILNVTNVSNLSNKVIDAQLIAICGGFDNYSMAIGTDADMGQPGMAAQINYEVMEGSIYYLQDLGESFVFTRSMKKIHNNAFTRMDSKFINKLKIAKFGFLPEYVGGGPNVDYTQEQMENYFKSAPFQNGDGTLVKWFEGKAFGDEGFPALDPKKVGWNGQLFM